MLTSRTLAVTALTACAIGLGGVGTASATTVKTDQPRCGFFYMDNEAWYIHCGTTNVEIKIDSNTLGSWTECVPPGGTDLGPAWAIDNAYYIGLCH